MPQPLRNIDYATITDDLTIVTVCGQPMGELKLYDRDIWTYDHDGTSFVGTAPEVKLAIERVYRRS